MSRACTSAVGTTFTRKILSTPPWRAARRDPSTCSWARGDYRAFYFHPSSLLSTELPAAGEARSSYVYDPRDPVPTIGGTSYFLTGRNAETGRWNLFVPYGPHDQRERPEYFGCTTSLP